MAFPKVGVEVVIAGAETALNALSAIDGALSSLTSTFESFGDAAGTLGDATGFLTESLGDLVGAANAVGGVVPKSMGALVGMIPGFEGLGNAIGNIPGVLFAIIPPLNTMTLMFFRITVALKLVKVGFMLLLSAAEKLLRGIVNLVKSIATGLVNALKSVLGFLGRVVKGFFSFLSAINPLNIALKVLKSTMVQVMTGQLLADMFKSAAQGAWDLVKASAATISTFQALQIQMEGLLAREMARGEVIEQTTTKIVTMTDAEKLRLIELQREYDALGTEISELQTDYDAMVALKGRDAEESLRLSVQLSSLQGKYSALGGAIADLSEKQKGYITTTELMAINTMTMAEALGMAAEPAAELLDWIKQIAITSPFTIETITRTVTMAMAYGFAKDEAKELTLSVLDFTAGMGLSNDAMLRIIENFGQMAAAGKVTGTELRDLARGSLVPVNDVLAKMQENLGMTNITFDEFKQLASEGKVPVEAFFDAFMEVSADFKGAGERMMQTFQGITSNMQDFIDVVLFMGLLGPSFQVFTDILADFMDVLVSPTVRQGVEGLGEVLGMFAGILGDIVGIALDEFTPKIEDFFERLRVASDFALQGNFGGALLALGFDADFAARVNEIIDPLGGLDEIIDKLTDTMSEFFDQLAKGNFKEAFLTLGVPEWIINTLNNLWLAFQNLGVFFTTVGPAVIEGLGLIFDAIFDVDREEGEGGATIIEDLSLAILGFTETLKTNAPAIAGKILEISGKIAEWIDVMKGLIDDFKKDPAGMVSAWVMGIVDAFAVEWPSMWETIKEKLGEFWTWLKDAWESDEGVAQDIRDAFSNAWAAIETWWIEDGKPATETFFIETVAPELGTIIGNALGALGNIVFGAADDDSPMAQFMNALWIAFKDGFADTFNKEEYHKVLAGIIGDVFLRIAELVSGKFLVDKFLVVGKALGEAIFGALQQAIEDGGMIGSFITWLVDTITAFLTGEGSSLPPYVNPDKDSDTGTGDDSPDRTGSPDTGVTAPARQGAPVMDGLVPAMASSPVMGASAGGMMSSVQNNTLNVHTSAPHEPIIDDFKLLEAMGEATR